KKPKVGIRRIRIHKVGIFSFLSSVLRSISISISISIPIPIHPSLNPTSLIRLESQSIKQEQAQISIPKAIASAIMATPDIIQLIDERLLASPLYDPSKADGGKSRGLSIEKKIEFLENLAGKVTNRRSRRWINDRLLMELVPRLSANEIKGLFAPPPWGDAVPASAFSVANMGEWEKFRNIDMDKQANILDTFDDKPSSRRKGSIDADKMSALNAWRRIDARTREALRRSFLTELIDGYEVCIRAFIQEDVNGEVLTIRAQDPFHRLLLHGVCEFYNLESVTMSEMKGGEELKMTKINKKKKRVADELPNITLSGFLKMTKEGVW
ncbi:hypothetical protein LINGRAHAP2_LOCUS17637, partial [Linum grandiflorum]